MIASPSATPLSQQEANAEVKRIYDLMFARCETVTNCRFLCDLQAGTLSPKALRVFWLNWHGVRVGDQQPYSMLVSAPSRLFQAAS